jgi:hypothetical protein
MKKRGRTSVKKGGLSSIIVTVLLIGITIVAVGIVWLFVRNIIQTGTNEVGLSQLSLSAEISNVHVDNSSNNISLSVKRNAGEGDLSGISFVFSSDAGTEIITKNVSLNELEQTNFVFHLNTNVSNIVKISIAPLYKDKSEKEVLGKIVNTYNVVGGGGGGGGGSSTSENPACVPQTCSSLGYQCGSGYSDECSDTLNCGSCLEGQFCNLTSKTCYNNSCIDTDGGINYYLLGAANINGQNWTDYCFNVYLLTEFYCVNNSLFSSPYNCLSGCENGTCLNITCTDSDGGRNYYTKGTFTWNNGTTLNDTCYNANSLKELQCINNSTISDVAYTCPNGCFDGACNTTCSEGTLNYACSTVTNSKYCVNGTLINSCSYCGCDSGLTCNTTSQTCYTSINPTCTDTDGGINYYLLGAANINGQNWTDYCSNSSSLTEFYCINNSLLFSSPYNCPANSSCFNGACLNTTCLDGTLNSSCSFTKPKYCSNGILIDKCLSCGCTNDKSCNFNQTCSLNQCSDSDGGLDYYTKGTITLNNGTINDTCTNVRGLKEWQCLSNKPIPVDYTCPNGCFNGACLNSMICNDSDGGLDYYVRGTVTLSNGTIVNDVCYNTNTLGEFQCTSDNSFFQSSYNCPNGCFNGACLNVTVVQNQTCNINGLCYQETSDVATVCG